MEVEEGGAFANGARRRKIKFMSIFFDISSYDERKHYPASDFMVRDTAFRNTAIIYSKLLSICGMVA